MAYAYVGTANNNASGTTVTYSPTNGNMILLLSYTSAGGGSPTCSATTNTSTAFSNVVPTTAFGGDYVSLLYLVAGAGVTSITASYVGGTPGTCKLWAIEYSGLSATPWTAGASVTNSQATPGVSADGVTSGSLAYSGGVPALVFGFHGSNGIDNVSAGTGYTSRVINTPSGAMGNGLFQDKRITVTGSIASTCTVDNGGFPMNSILAVFTEAGGVSVAADPLQINAAIRRVFVNTVITQN